MPQHADPSIDMTKTFEIAGFFLKSVIAGLALAFVLVYLWPSLGERLGARQRDEGESGRNAPASYADAVDRAAPSVVSIYTQSVELQPVSPQLQKLLGSQYVARSLLRRVALLRSPAGPSPAPVPNSARAFRTR